MNKKILAVSILAVFMLVAISFATAINTTPAKKKESPLFKIRTKLAIGERLENLRENIKAKFVGERIFFLPFQWIKNHDNYMGSPTEAPKGFCTSPGMGCPLTMKSINCDCNTDN